LGHKHVPESELVQFRVSKELATGLNEVAVEQELSRSEYLRRLVERDLAGELVALPDLDGEVDVGSLSRKALLALDRRLTTNPDALPGTGLMNLVERNLRLEEEKQRDDGPRFKYLDDAYAMVREFEASVLASALKHSDGVSPEHGLKLVRSLKPAAEDSLRRLVETETSLTERLNDDDTNDNHGETNGTLEANAG
jgi:hypothetical protein